MLLVPLLHGFWIAINFIKMSQSQEINARGLTVVCEHMYNVHRTIAFDITGRKKSVQTSMQLFLCCARVWLFPFREMNTQQKLHLHISAFFEHAENPNSTF